MRTRIDEVFGAALDLPPQRRTQFLNEACGDEVELREAVESLLHASEESDPWLQTGGAQKGNLFDALVSDVGAEDALEAGCRIDRYRVIRELGRGGMAVVYLAERADGRYQQEVALKVLKRGLDTEEVIRRFHQERQILASLDHPAIARLLDGGSTRDGRPFLVMEAVDGQPIDRYCDQRRLRIEERLLIYMRVAEVVQFAHRNLVIHRDLKCSNILVTDEGRIKLLDFGIAKLLVEDPGSPASHSTRTGARVMTPEWASPEQIRGQTVTTASDVYQLGLLLYELLTGHRPHRRRGRAAFELEQEICLGEVEEPSAKVANPGGSSDRSELTAEEISSARRTVPARLRKRLKGDLDSIVMKTLRRDPERRYATVERLRVDLERHLEGRPVAARRITVGYRLGKFLRRNRTGVQIAAAVLLLLGLVTGVNARRVAREQVRVQLQAEKTRHVAVFLRQLFEFSDPNLSQGQEISARELLDRGARRISEELVEEPEIRAEMMTVLGEIYCELGLYDRAGPLLEKALEIRESLFRVARASPEDRLPSLKALARLHSNQGRYGEAQALLDRARPIVEQVYGIDHLEAADLDNRSGLLRVAVGEYEEGRNLFRRALEIRRTSLGPDQSEVGESLNDLGGATFRLGQHDEAMEYFGQALAIRQRNLGPDHPKVADSLNNLAAVHQTAGRQAEAEPQMLRALAIWEKALGRDHPRLGRAFNNLATLYARQGRLAEAEEHFRQSLAIRERALSADHPEVLSCLRNLAMLCQLVGRYGDAEGFATRSLSGSQRALGDRHPAVASAARQLGALYREQGELEQAEPLLRRALEIDREPESPVPFGLGLSLYEMGEQRSQQGRLEEAARLLLSARDLFEKHLEPDSFQVAVVLVRLASLLARQGDLDEAESLYGRVLAIAEQRRGRSESDPSHAVALADALLGLGMLEDRRGDPLGARERWQEALEVINTVAETTGRVEALHLKAMVLLRLGRLEEAGPVVDHLHALGWRDRQLSDLCRQHRLDPEAVGARASSSS